MHHEHTAQSCTESRCLRRRRAFCPSSSSRPLPFLLRFVFDISGPSHYFLIISSLFHNSLFLCSFQYPECFSAQSAQLEHTFITFIISAFSQHIKLLSFTWMFLLLCQLCRFNGGLFLKPPPKPPPPTIHLSAQHLVSQIMS